MPWARCGTTCPWRRNVRLGIASRSLSESSAPSASRPSSGSPMKKPSTTGARSIDSSGVVDANARTEHRRAVARLQLRHLGGVGLERRRRARKHNQGGMKLVGVEPGDEIFDRRAVAVRSSRRTLQPRSRNSAAPSASVYGGFVVPSTSSRSWHRPCRVNAMPTVAGSRRAFSRQASGYLSMKVIFISQFHLAASSADRKEAAFDEALPEREHGRQSRRLPATGASGRPLRCG